MVGFFFKFYTPPPTQLDPLLSYEKIKTISKNLLIQTRHIC